MPVDNYAAGITNGSDFSRYSRSPKHYIYGSMASVWAVGTLVSASPGMKGITSMNFTLTEVDQLRQSRDDQRMSKDLWRDLLEL